jgi:hypothetical protein
MARLAGGNGNNETELARLAILREEWQERTDEQTLEQWEYHHRLRRTHQGLADEHRRQIEAMQPEYVAAVRRAHKRWDEAHGRTRYSRSSRGTAMVLRWFGTSNQQRVRR